MTSISRHRIYLLPDRSNVITLNKENEKPETVLLEDIARNCHNCFPCDVREAVYKIGFTYHEEALCKQKSHDRKWSKIYSQRAIYAFQFLLKCKSPVKRLCVSALYYIRDLHYQCTDLRDPHLSGCLFDAVVRLSKDPTFECSEAKRKITIIRDDVKKRYRTINKIQQVLKLWKSQSKNQFDYPEYINLLLELDESMEDSNSMPEVIMCSSDN